MADKFTTVVLSACLMMAVTLCGFQWGKLVERRNHPVIQYVTASLKVAGSCHVDSDPTGKEVIGVMAPVVNEMDLREVYGVDFQGACVVAPTGLGNHINFFNTTFNVHKEWQQCWITPHGMKIGENK